MIKNNEEFVCIHCGTHVEKHPTSSRDHCTNCLHSLHVDNIPGDRANECKGVLEPIGIKSFGSKMQIVYRCQRCHKEVANIVASDDNMEIITELMLLAQ
jgi:DNA-directed RNA polymerase subunit RPC12/RpoP